MNIDDAVLGTAEERLRSDLLALVDVLHWTWLAEMGVPGALVEVTLAHDEMSRRFSVKLMELFEEDRKMSERMRRVYHTRPAVSDVEEIIQIAEEWPALASELGFADGIVVGIDCVPATDANGNRIPDDAW